MSPATTDAIAAEPGRLPVLLRELADRVEPVEVPPPPVVLFERRWPMTSGRAVSHRRRVHRLVAAAVVVIAGAVGIAAWPRPGDPVQTPADVTEGLHWLPDHAPSGLPLVDLEDEVDGGWPLHADERMQVFRRPGDPVGGGPTIVATWRKGAIGGPDAPSIEDLGQGILATSWGIANGSIELRAVGLSAASLRTAADGVRPVDGDEGFALSDLPEGLRLVRRESGRTFGPGLTNPATQLVYGEYSAGGPGLTIRVTRGGGVRLEQGAVATYDHIQPVTIRGHEGLYWRDQNVRGGGADEVGVQQVVMWAEGDIDFWISSENYGDLDELLAVATSLRAARPGEWEELDRAHQPSCEANEPGPAPADDPPLAAFVAEPLPAGMQFGEEQSDYLPPPGPSPRASVLSLYWRAEPFAAVWVQTIDESKLSCTGGYGLGEPTPGLVVHGQPAALSSDDSAPVVHLAWREASQVIVALDANGLTETELLEFAEGLTVDGQDPIRYRPTRAPEGMVPAGPDSDQVVGTRAFRETFYTAGKRGPTARVQVYGSELAQVVASILQAVEVEWVDVRGHDAVAYRVGSDDLPQWTVAWQERPGLTIVVQAEGLSRDAALAIAGSVVEVEPVDWRARAAG